MLSSFPLVFIRLSLYLLISTLVVGMTNEENFDRLPSRPCSSTGGEDCGYRKGSFEVDDI